MSMTPGDDDFGGLLAHLNDLQRHVSDAQNQLGVAEVEGSAGGGAVTVTVSGEFSFTSVHISEDVVVSGQAQLVEDLVLAALHDATTKLGKAREDVIGATMGDVMGALFADASSLGDLDDSDEAFDEDPDSPTGHDMTWRP